MSIYGIELNPKRMFRRWFAFLGGGFAWTFHLMTIYLVGEFGCVSGIDRQVFAGVSAVAWLIIIVSAASLAPALAATWIGYADVRRDARQADPAPDDEGGRYLSQLGWQLNAVFTVIILVETMPVFGYLGGC